MFTPAADPFPRMTRRTAVQAGALGLAGLSLGELQTLRGATVPAQRNGAKACISIFLSGGLSQHESFDPKPEAPDTIRGEFRPIATQSPGVEICEHLPMLAQRSDRWAVVRSLTHPTNDHTLGHYFMLTGRSIKSPNFVGDRKPRPTDWPSIVSQAGDALPARNPLLPKVITLPERLVHWSGGTIPGAFGGIMGSHRDPFFIEASPYGDPFWRGAYPEYTFANQTKKPPAHPDDRVFRAPNLTLAPGMHLGRIEGRAALLKELDRQRRDWDAVDATERYSHQQQAAISLLASPDVRDAFDVTQADEATQRRYGRNSFGWSLLMAFRLVAAGVNLVQVNLGNNETWDMHGDIFYRMREKLLPPTDRALSALLDDLHETGLLDSTLVAMSSEFGRTPKLSTLADSYPAAGRDHWGAVQSVFFAGGGIRGGTIVGSSDKHGAYPASQPQQPENFAATIYHALGIPETAAWHDELGRPHPLYHGTPIGALF